MTEHADQTWEGVFATFAETNGDTTIFDGETWLERTADGAKRAMAKSEGGAIPPIATTTEYALPFVAAIIAERGRAVRILDFGGGMAASWLPLRAMLPREQAIEFVVVERESVCRKGREIFAGDKSLSFRSDLPSPPERFDIVHFGSAIQYVDDWKGLLANVRRLEPRYLLLADVPAADNVTFVTAQKYRDRRMPVRFWNAADFVAGVSSLGFELLFRSRFHGYYLPPGATLPTGNFDEAHRLTYTSQFVFRSITKE